MMKNPTMPVREGITINDNFFSPKLDKFYRITLPDTFHKFEAEKTLDNWRHAAEGKGEHYKQSFYDGLIYELIRGAISYPEAAQDTALQERIDAYIELFATAQDYEGDGFVDTYTTLVFPKQRFGHHGGNTVWQHNTYNQGALLEAGMHYYQSTGKTRLLEMGIKSMNYLGDHIGPSPKWNVPPEHSMIEGALAELCDLMEAEPDLNSKLNVPLRSREEYLQLCHFFVHIHGHHEGRMTNPRYLTEYAQDHAPVELQTEAVGHAVRANLFYRGIAMLARLENDEKLWQVGRTIWNNITREKLYITAGTGTSATEEKYSYSYDLPNDGYLETCATAALIFFAQEMLRTDADGEYADVIERALYNLMLEAVSDAGDQYTYVNPMKSKGDVHRWQWNECPCCPPMIHKTFGQLDEMIYSTGSDSVYVNQYISSDLNTAFCTLSLRSNYPWDGRISIDVQRIDKACNFLKLRIPGWCKHFEIRINGKAEKTVVEKGYCAVSVVSGNHVELILDMPVNRMEAHPYVRQDNGRVAIQRGPVVYCLEGVDNKGLTDRELPENWQPELKWIENLCGGVMGIACQDAQGEPLLAVPYFSWDNRLCGSMDVWLRQQGKVDGNNTDGWENLLYRPYK